MSQAVRRVVVVGRDAAAWLTATALHRAFARTGVSVAVAELPSLLGPADVYSATPSLAGLHRLLGLEERDVLRVCRGLPVVGQRFSGWSGDGSAFVHGYDPKRAAINGIDFLQFWIKARTGGMPVPFEDFSAAAAAAKQGRLSPPETDPDAFGNVAPGYHLHARAYVGALRRLAVDSGVEHRSGELDNVEREGTRIRSVTLAGGVSVAGELFVDATGPDALLMKGQPGDSYESWAEWLPCDRVLTASGPPLSPLPAFSEIMAFDAGWIGLFPLQNRTAVTAVYSSAQAGDDRVLKTLVERTRIPLQGEATAGNLAIGGRAPWIGNCVAIGGAAAALEPLDAVHLHLVHVGISNLVALFPVDAAAMPEAGAYNAALARHIANVRNFQIAHYRLNRRVGEALWDRARDATGPAELEAKLRLFASRGKVPMYEDEPFQEQNWASIFVGHGLIPRSHEPLVDSVPLQEQMERMQHLLHLVATEVNAMPRVGEYLGLDRPARHAGMS